MPTIASPVPVRTLTIEQTSIWLSRGWADFLRQPVLSLIFGGIYPLVGLGLMAALQDQGLGSLIFLAASAFMLIGPVAAVCLYEVSRRLEADEPVSVSLVIASVRGRAGAIGDMGLALMIVLLSWFLIGFILFAFFFTGAPPSFETFIQDVLFNTESLPFILTGTVIGGALATLVFTISVFAMPMILDRDVSALDAMTFSVLAVWKNRMNMIGWAATIATVTFFGLAVGLIGLAVSFPVIAYASWHGYRDVAG